MKNSKKIVVGLAASMLLSTNVLAAKEFVDVKENMWFYKYVNYAFENGIMKGVSDNEFAPNENLSTAMLVQILYNFNGKAELEDIDIKGVNKSDWYYEAANWAITNNLISKDSEENYNLTLDAKREDVVETLYKYAIYSKMDVSVGESTNILSYNDVFDITSGKASAFCWACGAGVINGDENENLNPLKSITRAEVATIMERFDKLRKGEKIETPSKGEFEVRLDGNPTTGYVWEAKNYDSDVIEITYEYNQNESEEGMVGVPGEYKFKVKALKAGKSHIDFIYYRPWEGEESSIKKIIYDVEFDENLNLIAESSETV